MARKSAKRSARLEGKVRVKKLQDEKSEVLVESEAIPLIKARSAAQVAVFHPESGARCGFMNAMNLVA